MKIVNMVKSLAENHSCDYMIFTPLVKNFPISDAEKLDILHECFGENVLSFHRFCDVMHYIVDCGYESATMVIGSDRLADFKRMLISYQRDARSPIELTAISGGFRDASQDGVQGISSTKMKSFVETSKRYFFLDNVPETMSKNTALTLFNKMRNAK